MGRVFLGIVFGVLLVLLADNWELAEGLSELSLSRLLSSVQYAGPTVKSLTH